VRARRVGGATYQVPMEVPEDRSIACASAGFLHLRAPARRPYARALPRNLWKQAKRRQRHEKREDTHKMAEANKAFAHYNGKEIKWLK